MQNRNKKSQGIFEKYGYHIVIGGFLAMCAIAILTTLFRASTKLSQIPVNDQREIERHNLAGHSFKLGETEMFHVLFFHFSPNFVGILEDSPQAFQLVLIPYNSWGFLQRRSIKKGSGGLLTKQGYFARTINP
jgi:hypothetical protein